MQIISNGNKKNIIVLTYFKLGKSTFFSNNNREYIIYTTEQDTKDKIIYLARVQKMETVTNLLIPGPEELSILKDLIQNFLNKDFDLSLLLKNNFEYIDIKLLENMEINELKNKIINLTKEQYIKLISNKYLTYPKLTILNMDQIEKEDYNENNKKAKIICGFLLGIYFLIILFFYIISGINKFNDFSLLDLKSSILIWSLVILIVSMIAFNSEEKGIIVSWIKTYVLTILIVICSMIYKQDFKITNSLVISFIYSLIYIIPYVTSKKISFRIVNKFKIRNYITYCCIYMILFMPIILFLINIYNNYLYLYINKILELI